jgi:hypothetical protein
VKIRGRARSENLSWPDDPKRKAEQNLPGPQGPLSLKNWAEAIQEAAWAALGGKPVVKLKGGPGPDPTALPKFSNGQDFKPPADVILPRAPIGLPTGNVAWQEEYTLDGTGGLAVKKITAPEYLPVKTRDEILKYRARRLWAGQMQNGSGR